MPAAKATKLVPPGAAPFDVLDRNWRAGFDRVCRAGTAREDVAAVLHAVETCVGTRERPTAATFLDRLLRHPVRQSQPHVTSPASIQPLHSSAHAHTAFKRCL